MTWAEHQLGYLPGGDYSRAWGISEDGSTIVGESNATGVAAETPSLPVMWQNGTLVALALPTGCTVGVAFCANTDGSVIGGLIGNFSGDGQHACYWTNGGVVCVDIGTPVSGNAAQANGVTSGGGTILVNSAYTTGTGQAAYLCNAGSYSAPLPVPSGFLTNSNFAVGMSVAGVVHSNDAKISPFANHVLQTAGGVVFELPDLTGCTASQCYGISYDGTTVVGSSTDGSGNLHLVAWTAGVPADLGTPAGGAFASSGYAAASSADGAVVVASDIAGSVAALSAGVWTMLPVLTPGSPSAQPLAINGAGTVVIGWDGAEAVSWTAQPTPPRPSTPSHLTLSNSTPPGTVLGAPAGPNVVGDYRNGNLYVFNLDQPLDNGTQRRWLRRWRALSQPDPNPHRFVRLTITMETGAQVPDGTSPTIELRWSDDGGHRWSNRMIAQGGQPGETARRVFFTPLGSTKASTGLDRIWELSSSDPMKVSIISAELEP